MFTPIVSNHEPSSNSNSLNPPRTLCSYEVVPLVNKPLDAVEPIERDGHLEISKAAIVIVEDKRQIAVYPLGDCAPRASTLIYYGEAARIGEFTPMRGWYRNKQGYLIGIVIERIPLNRCAETVCDEYGQTHRYDDHCHVRTLNQVGEFIARVWFEETLNSWVVDQFAVPDDMLTPAQTQDFITALSNAASEAQRLNERTLKRPVNCCAEPQLEGIGGGL